MMINVIRYCITIEILTKISFENILPSYNAILVMKRGTLQKNDQIGRRDIMLIPPKKMNQQTKDSEERRMIHMKSM